jgi:drug/metabolite transporter (DMT)-like permease
LIDGAGARAGGDPIGYAALLFTGLGPASLLWAWTARRRELYPAMAKQWRVGVGGGATSVLAYGIVIWAQTIAPIALVAALRETGVIAGAVIGVVAFRERMPAARIAAATVVVLGIVLLNAAS